MATTMTRPPMSIERLTGTSNTHKITSEQREVMNCKSCRKRKIKCNRLRPKCESCKIFQCPCLYDAVPKKRGPKTEVIENLLKRVNELEKRQQGDEKSTNADAVVSAAVDSGTVRVVKRRSSKTSSTTSSNDLSRPPILALDTAFDAPPQEPTFSPLSACEQTTTDILLETYFARVHKQPYHIVDEASIRHQHRAGQLPMCLELAMWAVAASTTTQTNGYNSSLQICEDYAIQSRSQINVDEPSILAIQSLLLLHHAFFACGLGRKAYMCLSQAISMAIALELHRELPSKTVILPEDRETRRQVFWACYLLDRLSACGTKRPMLIYDDSIILRLPSWSPFGVPLPVEGEYFSSINFRPQADTDLATEGNIVMLIDIARILGTTNRYLANGGVKGEMHFPWHSSSSLFQIRSELDVWAASNQDILSSDDILLTRPDHIVLFTSKLIYHVIHNLIYRPFLPVDLAELLQGSGQHKSFQIEATHLCFLHANAIADLVSTARQIPSLEWPHIVGYALTTAGIVHIHGTHYKGQEGDVFHTSSDFLTKEMQILTELRNYCVSVQHQKDTLQAIFVAHSDMIKAPSTNPLKYSPVFHLKDFFDRYPGRTFDGAYLSLLEAVESSILPQQRNTMKIPSNSSMALAHLQIQIPPANFFMNHPRTAPMRSPTFDRKNAWNNITSAPLQPHHDFGHFPGYTSTFPFSPSSSSGPFEAPTTMLSSYSTGNPAAAAPARALMQPDIPIDPALTALKPPSSSMDDTQKIVQLEDMSPGEDGIDPFLTLLEQFAEDKNASDFDMYLDETATVV